MRHRRAYRHRRFQLWLLTSVLAVGPLSMRPLSAAGQGAATSEPAVLQANVDGIVLEWRAPEFSLRHVVGDDGQIYSTLKTSEWAWTEEPGKPQLPVATVLAVVPPSGEVTLEMQDVERSQRSLDHPILPASAPEPVGEPMTHLGWTWARDEQACALDWPSDWP